MTRSLRALLFLLLSTLLLVACGSAPSAMRPRDQALEDYGVAIRWSEFVEALEFVDPALREKQPLSDLERERFKQLQVTGYDVKNKKVGAGGDIEQTVEIRLISKNTQVERSIIDHQRWHWDGKRYWLSSGLPDFTGQ